MCHTWTTAETKHPHTLPTSWTRQPADIRKSSGRGVLIPISSLLFHTVGDGACYSLHGESLRSTALQLPPCNQPLWLFYTHQSLIATFIRHYSRSVSCCRSTFVKNCLGHLWNKVQNVLTWGLISCCCWKLEEAVMNPAEKGLDPGKGHNHISLCNHNLGYEN